MDGKSVEPSIAKACVRLTRRLLPLHLARRTSQRVATTRVATRAAVRLAGSWKDDLRDVRCKIGLTGVGSLRFEHELNEFIRNYDYNSYRKRV